MINSNAFINPTMQKICLLLLLWMVATGVVFAQDNNIDLLLKTGNQADLDNNFKESKAAFERIIEIAPHNPAAHMALMNTKQRELIRMYYPKDGESFSPKAMEDMQLALKNFEKDYIARYEQLEKRFPDKAAYKLVLWRLNAYEPVKALNYLEAANRVEPNDLTVLSSTALFETSRGDNRKALEYYEKILKQKPDDVETGLYYLLALKEVDKKLYKQKTLDFVKRFPSDIRAFQALSILIYDTESESERISYYQELKKLFPPEKPNGSANQLTGLFEIYHLNDPDKALSLAQEMVNIAPNDGVKKSWQSYLDYQSGINQAAALIKQKKSSEAVALLEKVKIPRYFSNASPYYLMKAQAQDTAGQTNAAYTELLKYFAEKPRKIVRQSLETLGKKIGKDKNQVNNDILALVSAQTKSIKDFSLVRFDTGKKVSLADYKGKVVLMNFWYPLCGPCHQEAPYLQKLTEKYGKDGFVILAINAHPKEDTMVLPYFQKTKYNFIPLQVPDEEFSDREYQAKGFPTNYLIDKQGRMIFNIGVVYQTIFEEVQQKVEIALQK